MCEFCIFTAPWPPVFTGKKVFSINRQTSSLSRHARNNTVDVWSVIINRDRYVSSRDTVSSHSDALKRCVQKSPGHQLPPTGPRTIGVFFSRTSMPPLEQIPPSSSHIQVTQTIYTDLGAIRQQLLPHHQWTVYDNQDMRSSVLWRLDYSLPAPAITDYRSRRGAPHKWRVTSSAWASHIWMLPKTSLRRRGTLLKTI